MSAIERSEIGDQGTGRAEGGERQPSADEIFSGGTSVGQTSEHIYKGFITHFPQAFLDHHAADDRLMVFRTTEGTEEPVLVADFGLSGDGAAVAALR